MGPKMKKIIERDRDDDGDPYILLHSRCRLINKSQMSVDNMALAQAYIDLLQSRSHQISLRGSIAVALEWGWHRLLQTGQRLVADGSEIVIEEAPEEAPFGAKLLGDFTVTDPHRILVPISIAVKNGIKADTGQRSLAKKYPLIFAYAISELVRINAQLEVVDDNNN